MVALLRGRPRPNVREFPPPPPGQAPPLSVVVPARNEARNIERCVRSLLASSYPDLEVIVVDDRSTDGTAEIIRALAAQHSRLRVIEGRELPADWFGKPWACWQGYQAARGGVLLFTDADTTHGPALHGHAVGFLLAERAALVTVMPHQLALTFWERVVQPHFFLLLGVRYGSAAQINRNTDPRHAIANGQFIMVTRESYEAVGGHQAVKDQVVEDLALAQAYTAAGLALRFAAAEEVMATRMYASLAEIVEGWSKNSFIGMTRMARTRLGAWAWLGAALAFLSLWLLPLLALAAGLLWNSAALTAYGVVAVCGSLAMMGVMLWLLRAPLGYAPLYPLGALVAAYILLRAAARGGRRIEWKGRSYSNVRANARGT